MAAWIEMIGDEEADPTLLKALDHARAPSGKVDNVMRVHSLRPHTMLGHHKLYMAALHNDGNTLPDWFLEVIASYVSILNRCDYSLANHWTNAAHLIGDAARASDIRAALDALAPEQAFDGGELAMLRYAGKLTTDPADMTEGDVLAMRQHGVGDGEILEVNQVCGYFNYVNRLLNGLGVTTEGDTLGYYNSPDGG